MLRRKCTCLGPNSRHSHVRSQAYRCPRKPPESKRNTSTSTSLLTLIPCQSQGPTGRETTCDSVRNTRSRAEVPMPRQSRALVARTTVVTGGGEARGNEAMQSGFWAVVRDEVCRSLSARLGLRAHIRRALLAMPMRCLSRCYAAGPRQSGDY